MKKLFRPRRLVTILALTAIWCGLWGTISVANVAAGILIAIVVTLSGLGTRGSGTFRLAPLAKLLWFVLVDLVKSTGAVALEILTPADRTDESIIAVNPDVSDRDHFLLLVIAITLTPGTAVVDTDPDTGTLYLHLLHHKRRDETIEHVNQLARLAHDALPITPTGAHL